MKLLLYPTGFLMRNFETRRIPSAGDREAAILNGRTDLYYLVLYVGSRVVVLWLVKPMSFVSVTYKMLHDQYLHLRYKYVLAANTTSGYKYTAEVLRPEFFARQQLSQRGHIPISRLLKNDVPPPPLDIIGSDLAIHWVL